MTDSSVSQSRGAGSPDPGTGMEDADRHALPGCRSTEASLSVWLQRQRELSQQEGPGAGRQLTWGPPRDHHAGRRASAYVGAAGGGGGGTWALSP